MKTNRINRTAKNSIVWTLAFILLIAGTQATAQSATSNSSNNSDNLPALLLSFTGSFSTNNVELNWTMENETSCKLFVIERAGVDGSFDSIGVVQGLNNAHEHSYSFTDHKMMNGDNFYRICQVSMDGAAKYSKVLCFTHNATVNSSAKMVVYPNPAVSMVNYSVTLAASQQVLVQVYNMAGVLMMTQEQALSSGVNQQSVAISSLKSGRYFLKVTNLQGTSQYIEPFVKLL
jgi:hypothetical protein